MAANMYGFTVCTSILILQYPTFYKCVITKNAKMLPGSSAGESESCQFCLNTLQPVYWKWMNPNFNIFWY